MSFMCKFSVVTRGRHLLVQKDSFKRDFLVSIVQKDTRKVYQPFAQTRLYSTDNENQSIEKRERIYDGMLHNKIRFVKIFSLITSAGSLLCQPYLISKALEDGKGTGAIGAIVVSFGFFAFITPIMLHLITKRYIVHVDYNPTKDIYVATTYSLFVRKKEIEFTPEDVTLPTMSELLTSCMIKGKPMFMDLESFSDINHYKRIMGFDKPMDFSLNAETVKSKKD